MGWKRSGAALVGCLILVLGAASCSDDDTPAAASTTTAPAASAESTTAEVAEPASITPFVLCRDVINNGPLERGTDGFYFGYESSGTEPALVPAGPDNALAAALEGDRPNVPSVFAPGRVPAAFLAITTEDGPLPSWTIRGPDGTAQTATATADAATCTPELLEAGDRAIEVTYTARTLPEGSTTPTQVEVTATVDAVPERSECPDGLDPLAPLVELALGDTRTIGTTSTVVLTVETVAGTDGVNGVRTLGVVRVADRCAAGDAVTETWPTDTALVAAAIGSDVCFEVTGDTTTEFECPRLPVTGGVRVLR